MSYDKEWLLKQHKSNRFWGHLNLGFAAWNLFAAVCLAKALGFIILHCLLVGVHVYLANSSFVRAKWWKEKADEHK